MPNFSNENNWIVRSPTQHHKLERIDAFLSNYAYKPHRHDIYAISRTLSGVQNFHYKGVLQHSLPGMTMVLHPDEKHDGESGTLNGYRYRMIYIEPAMIQTILKGKPLPFIRHGLSHDIRLLKATDNFLSNINNYMDTLEEEDALFDLATVLCEISDTAFEQNKQFDYKAAEGF